MNADLRILGMSPGKPFDPRTSSGIVRSLFTALARRNILAGGISMRPSPLEDALVRVRAFPVPRRRWVRRYRLSMPLVRAFADTGTKSLGEIGNLE